MIDSFVREGGEPFRPDGGPRTVGPRGVAVGFVEPGCSVGVRQMVDADAVLGPDIHHLVGMTLHAGMDGAAETDGAAAEQTDMVLGPVICTLIVRAQNVVAQREGIDVGPRPLHLRPDPGSGALVQAFIIVEEQDPLMLAQ